MVDDVPRTFGLDGPAPQEKAGQGVEQIVIDRATGRLLGRQWLAPDGVHHRAEIVRRAG